MKEYALFAVYDDSVFENLKNDLESNGFDYAVKDFGTYKTVRVSKIEIDRARSLHEIVSKYAGKDKTLALTNPH